MEPQETKPEVPSTNQPTNIIAAVATSIAMIAIAVVIILHNNKTGESPSAAQQDQQQVTDSKPIPTDIATVRPGDKNYVRGNLDTADVVIFEYSDSDCPFCAKFHPTLQQIVSDYKGKIAWVYRFFPLDMHPNARTEALALACAGQLGGSQAFNEYIDSVIDMTLTPGTKSNDLLATLATQQGLNANQFKSCMNNADTAKLVDADIAEAQNIGAQGTPFSIVMNTKTGKQTTLPGAYPIEEVRKAIDSVLK